MLEPSLIKAVAPAVPVVGHLRNRFLPRSETFIYTRITSSQASHAKVFCTDRELAERFPFPNVYCLRERETTLSYYAYRFLKIDGPFLRWIGEEHIDIVHAHHGQTAVWALPALGRGLPLVVSFYGRDVTVLGNRQRLRPEFYHYGKRASEIFEKLSLALALSHDMRQQLIAIGCPEERIAIVRLGCDLDVFVPAIERDEQTFAVLMVGRMIEKKGFSDGLRAFALFARELSLGNRKKALLRIIGYGPLEADLRREAKDLNIGEVVEFLSPDVDVPRIMQASHVLLAPSKTAANGDKEGTPTVICEGSATGLPIVSTTHAGIPEQVAAGETGMLYAEGDWRGMALGLFELFVDRDVARRMGAAGRAKMEREFNPAIEARRLDELYMSLLSSSGSRIAF